MTNPLLVAICVLAGFATGQDGERARLRGMVVDARGAPWIGAHVTLHGRPVVGFDSIGTADRIEVTSDERGRFTANVLTDRSYFVWATADAGKDLYRASHPVARVRPGRPLRLVEQSRSFVRVRFEIRGKAGGLSMKITNGSMGSNLLAMAAANPTNWPVVLEHALDGRSGRLPRLPWPVCRVELFDGQRRVLEDAVTLAKDIREKLLAAGGPKPSALLAAMTGFATNEQLASLTEDVLHSKESKLARFEVRGHDGKKLAGASVGIRLRGRVYPLATTDAEGRAEAPRIDGDGVGLILRGAVSPSASELVFTADGHAEMLPGLLSPFRTKATTTVQLPMGRAVSGRVLMAGKPVVGLPLIAYTRLRVGPAFGALFPLLPVVYATDAEGRFRIPNCGTGTVRIAAVLDAKYARAIGCERFAMIADRDLKTPKDWAFGDVELSKVRRVHIAARDSRRGEVAQRESGGAVRRRAQADEHVGNRQRCRRRHRWPRGRDAPPGHEALAALCRARG